MQITTPSGYIVTLKDKLSFGENRQLQKVLVGDAKVEMVNGKPVEPSVAISKTIDYSDKAMGFLITKVVKGDIVVTSDFEKEVFSWDDADGQAVLDQVAQIINPTKTAEEKEAEEKKTV